MTPRPPVPDGFGHLWRLAAFHLGAPLGASRLVCVLVDLAYEQRSSVVVVGRRKLMRETAVGYTRTLERSIEWLTEHGLLRVSREGQGRGTRTSYELRLPPELLTRIPVLAEAAATAALERPLATQETAAPKRPFGGEETAAGMAAGVAAPERPRSGSVSEGHARARTRADARAREERWLERQGVGYCENSTVFAEEAEKALPGVDVEALRERALVIALAQQLGEEGGEA